jgi:hypothetical protein
VNNLRYIKKIKILTKRINNKAAVLNKINREKVIQFQQLVHHLNLTYVVVSN